MILFSDMINVSDKICDSEIYNINEDQNCFKVSCNKPLKLHNNLSCIKECPISTQTSRDKIDCSGFNTYHCMHDSETKKQIDEKKIQQNYQSIISNFLENGVDYKKEVENINDVYFRDSLGNGLAILCDDVQKGCQVESISIKSNAEIKMEKFYDDSFEELTTKGNINTFKKDFENIKEELSSLNENIQKVNEIDFKKKLPWLSNSVNISFREICENTNCFNSSFNTNKDLFKYIKINNFGVSTGDILILDSDQEIDKIIEVLQIPCEESGNKKSSCFNCALATYKKIRQDLLDLEFKSFQKNDFKLIQDDIKTYFHSIDSNFYKLTKNIIERTINIEISHMYLVALDWIALCSISFSFSTNVISFFNQSIFLQTNNEQCNLDLNPEVSKISFLSQSITHNLQCLPDNFLLDIISELISSYDSIYISTIIKRISFLKKLIKSILQKFNIELYLQNFLSRLIDDYTHCTCKKLSTYCKIWILNKMKFVNNIFKINAKDKGLKTYNDIVEFMRFENNFNRKDFLYKLNGKINLKK